MANGLEVGKGRVQAFLITGRWSGSGRWTEHRIEPGDEAREFLGYQIPPESPRLYRKLHLGHKPKAPMEMCRVQVNPWGHKGLRPICNLLTLSNCRFVVSEAHQ